MREIEGNRRTIRADPGKLYTEVQMAEESRIHLETDLAELYETDSGSALGVFSGLEARFLRDLQIYREILGRDISRLKASIGTLQQEDQKAAGIFLEDPADGGNGK